MALLTRNATTPAALLVIINASDDPTQLDTLIDEFDAVNPTDRDIMTAVTPAESAVG